MSNLEQRHKIKFLRMVEKELNNFNKPIILEFGVSGKALSTSIFLKNCEEKMVFYILLTQSITVIISIQKIGNLYTVKMMIMI